MIKKQENNILILKKFKLSKYLVVSTLVHFFVILMFLCPHIFFKKERKFISNNIMAVNILIQEKSINKTKKQKKDINGISNKKVIDKQEKLDNQSHQENIKESIIANQFVTNINYNILKSSEPSYPSAIKRLNLSQEIIIKTRLLIDKQGNIEKIEFIGSNLDKSIEHFFHKEIINSLNTWKFSPVTVDNKPVRIYFYKNFVFQNS